jgi:outer membrane protein OmpA-like peptidoglycan-associated protein
MNFLLSLLLILLAACAPAPSGSPKAPQQVDLSGLRQQLALLPGVEVQEEPLAFSYPEQVMFGKGAVLPMPGGPTLLDPLAAFLKHNPQLVWQVEVRAQTDQGQAYDQALAEKRSELLATYLLSKGAELKNLHFQPRASAGVPLELRLAVTEKPNQ